MTEREMKDFVCEACGSQEFEWREEQVCAGCDQPASRSQEKKNAVNWFEIPVADMARALKFYGIVFGAELNVQEGMGSEFAMFPAAEGGVGGALVKGEGYVPGTGGTLVYLNAGD